MQDEIFMRRCFDLAQKGMGYVAPNPMVGSVITHKGKIIGEGYHQLYGKAHAEVNAIESVKDKSLLKESTIYINLEPCAHFGKTPPCADLIIKHQIPNVVIGCIDSYSEVAGKGIERMRSKDIIVKTGVLEKEAIELNKRFFTFHNKQRPYVILKWAQSKDGYMDIDRDSNEKGQFWITHKRTKQLVHLWRHEEAGILVGKNTIINDNPSLTVREIDGISPYRFIIDCKQEIKQEDFNIGLKDAKTQIISGAHPLSVIDILKQIRNKRMLSIIIEGGKTTIEQFIESSLWDEARVLIADVKIKHGLVAPKLSKSIHKQYTYGSDTVRIFRND